MTAHASTAHSFELHAGALRPRCAPDLGGCIAGLWHRETPILRSVEPVELATAWPSAATRWCLLRTASATPASAGRATTSRRGPTGESLHSIHGVGWMRPWSACPPARWRWCCATATPPMPTGPSPSRRPSISTSRRSRCIVEMVVTNLAEVAQPVGLGWHPYFPKRARSRLHIELAERWDGDATGLPVRKGGAARHRRRRRAPGLRQLLRRLARRRAHPRRTLSLQLSSLDRLVVYTAGEGLICVEPVSHVSNAIHMADPPAHGLRSPRAGREHARLDAA